MRIKKPILLIFLLSSHFLLFAQQSTVHWVKLFSVDTVNLINEQANRLAIEFPGKTAFFIGIAKESIKQSSITFPGLKLMRLVSDNCGIWQIDKTYMKETDQYFTGLYRANDLWKLSPGLLEELNSGKEASQPRTYRVWVDEADIFTKKYPSAIVYKETTIFTVTLTPREYATLIKDKNVHYLQPVSMPAEELSISGFDNSVNKINMVHHQWPLLNGNSTLVSIKENLFDTTDIDFKGRILKTSISSPLSSTHASYMATIVGGAGNSFYTGKGAAWATTLSSSSFANLLPDATTFFQQNNIALQNHSYGTIIENFYGAEAAAYDAQANANPALLHVFSAGNKGTDAGTQTYAGINGFANTTGNFKMAKNIITVGHVDSFGTVLPLSSRGPAFDGRVKPELVAYAEDGSSGAAAIVSGVSLLVQQAYKEANGVLPSSALVKAVLFNSADDVGAKAIDYISGYGNVNAYKAIKTIQETRLIAGTVSNTNTINFPISIPVNAVNLKLTLTWNDPAAQVNTFKALVNDLDLQLTHDASNTIYKPWILNSTPNITALNQLAVRGRDSLNNAEQITIDVPAAGNYTISVTGFNIPSGTQNFYIAYQWDMLNHFQWQYPTGSDNIFSGTTNLLRWENSYSTTGKLEYSYDKGATWSLINSTVDLTKQNTYWSAPDTFSTGLLRMTIGTDIYVSDTFSISNIIPTGVGFNCTDSVMIFWKKIKGVQNYQVYSLSNRYLQPLAITSDTLYVIKKNVSPALHYTVAPLLNPKRPGMKSYTFNYTTQGVDCYLRNLLADLVNNTGRIQVFMGTLYNVKSICIEKLISGNYSCIKTFTPGGSLNYSFEDVSLIKGGNIYRARIELLNGQVITSYRVTLYYFDNSEFLFFPNPVERETGFTILCSSFEPSFIQLFNSTGQLVLQKQLTNFSEKINTYHLQKGMYFYLITRDDKKIAKGKIVIQ